MFLRVLILLATSVKKRVMMSFFECFSISIDLQYDGKLHAYQ